MSENAVNAGAINAVSFPGAQDGLSLVELVGAVVVTCSIAGVSLHLTASAARVAEARAGAPTVKILSRLGAATSASAGVAVNAVNKAPNAASVSALAAPSAPAVGIRRTASATLVAAASGASTSYVRATRSGQASALAATGAYANKKIPFAASASPNAATAANALRKVSGSVLQSASATSTATITLRRGVSSATTASATGGAASLGYKLTPAATVAAATGAAALVKMIKLDPVSASASAIVAAAAVNKAKVTAAAPATATTAVALRLRSRLSASATGAAASVVFARIENLALPMPLNALAVVSSPVAYTAFPAYGSTLASASGAALAGLKWRSACPTTAVAAMTAMPTRLRFGPSATTQASATTTAGIEIICTSTPVALTAVAAPSSPGVTLNILIGGATAAQAVGAAALTFQLRASASTIATAVASSVAMDYAASVPAPEERLMIVQASDRRMEVQL